MGWTTFPSAGLLSPINSSSGSPSFDLEISFEAQLLWDHAMAKSVAMALEEDVFFFFFR